jgi:hypothetical protein
MNPEGGTGGQTASKDGTIEIENNGVRVSLVYVERDMLAKAAPFLSRNPFMNENKVFFTVFEMTIENLRNEKISIDVSKIKMTDGLGNQYDTLMHEYFKGVYPDSVSQSYSYSPVFNEYQPSNHYSDDYHKNHIAGKLLLKSGDIFEHIKQKGYIVFDLARRETKQITVIVPEIIYFKDNKEIDRAGLRFKFSQEISVKKQE